MIRLTTSLWVWFQYVCPLMPSCNTYRLTWVSLTLGVGQSNHTRTTALSNSMKLSHARGAAQVEWAWWRGLTQCGPLEKRMANHFSILALRTPWTVWKGKMIRILKEELPRSVGTQYATGDQWRNNSRKNEAMEPKQKEYPAVDVTGDRSKVRCCKRAI